MYDKSKKTWSQRLKITKTEKSSFTATASVTTNSPVALSSSVANNANNIGGAKHQQQHQQQQQTQQQQVQQQQQQQQQRFQIQQFTGNVGKNALNSAHYQAMHLPNALQFSDYQNISVGYTTDYMSGTSSRAMKYAEPWIYSTVRGIPARHYHHLYQQTAPTYTHPHAAAIFASPPLTTTEALAVVICSCSEYLNGTKRDVKKASICKKCKGSRLPLATIGSVMPATKLRANGNVTGAATMRVISMTKKSRPTILDPQKDPYDLMRRSRLLSPEPTGSAVSNNSAKDKSRARGKSISPPRGRTRTRHQLPPSSSSSSQKKAITNEAGVIAANAKALQDCWLVEDDETLLRGSNFVGDSSMTPSSAKSSVQSRRSILRCNVNPYDLISIESNQETTSLVNGAKAFISTSTSKNTSTITTSQTKSKHSIASQNEFMPPNDDDFNVEDAALNEDEPPFITATQNNQNTQKRNTETHSIVNRLNRNSTKAASNGIAITAGASKGNKKNHQNSVRRTAPKRPISTTNSEQGRTTSQQAKNASSCETGNTSKMKIDSGTDGNDIKLNYSNVQAINGQRISLGKQSTSKKSLIKQSGDGHAYESIIIGSEEEEITEMTSTQMEGTRGQQSNREPNDNVKEEHSESLHHQLQPKRPPRSKKLDLPDATVVHEIELKHNTTQSNAANEVPTNVPDVTVLSIAPTQNIKSILKRPLSKSSYNGELSATIEVSTNVDGITSRTPVGHKESSSTSSSSSLSPGLGSDIKSTTSLSINQTSTSQTTATSQFYIPLPQQSRKKVQFMMEDKVIHHKVDDSNNSPNSEKKHQTSRHKANNDANGNAEQSVSCTANYEYYNKKRQQYRLSLDSERISHKMQANSFHGNGSYDGDESELNNAAATTIHAAVLKEIQQESDLISRGQNGSDTKVCNTESNEIMNDSTVTDDKTLHENKLNISDIVGASITNSTVNANIDSTYEHYEDVIISETQQQIQPQQQQQRRRPQEKVTNGNNKQDLPIMNQQNLRLEDTDTATTSKRFLPSSKPSHRISSSLQQSTSASTTTTTMAMATSPTMTTLTSAESIRSTSSVLLMPSTILSLSQIKLENDGQHAADATVDRCHDVISFSEVQVDGDYDDIACKKLQALVESDSTVRATQSRNPIRRSHSERMPVYNKLTSAGGIENTNADGSPKGRQNDAHSKHSHSHSNNNSSKNTSNGSISNSSGTSIFGLNFKDTTALRMKNNHKDSRNLFSQNNSSTPVTALAATSFAGTTRPKVPPPPPPTPPPNSTIASPTINTRGDIVSSVKGATEKATTTTWAVSASPATTATPTLTTMTTATTATTTTLATTATTTRDATTSSSKENFLSLSPSAQAHSADNDDRENRRRKQTSSPLTTASISTATATATEKKLEQEEEQVKEGDATTKSGRRLDSKKQQHHEQKSLLECTEAFRRNERNQKNSIDKSVLNRKSNGTSTTASGLSVVETNTIDGIDTKLILKEKPQQQLPSGQNQPNPKTTFCALDSRTMPTDYNNTKSNGNSKRTTIFDSPQRTVVRVAPFNKSSSEVHRLKISHTDDIGPNELTASINQRRSLNSVGNMSSDDNESAYTQKKTSILINGDDCYSTVNLGMDASTPIYQSSVVVADYSSSPILRHANNGNDTFTYEGLKVTTTSNMVTINLSSPRSVEGDLIEQHNKVNKLRTRQAKTASSCGRAIIPIKGTSSFETGLHRSASSTSSASTSSAASISSSGNASGSGSDSAISTMCKRGRTLIKLDYGEDKVASTTTSKHEMNANSLSSESNGQNDLMSHEAELLKILRNPVEAVKRNLVPHVCGRNDGKKDGHENARNRKMKESGVHIEMSKPKHVEAQKETTIATPEVMLLRAKECIKKTPERNSFIAKLLEDPTLGQVADGLETETVAELIENSLKRLKETRNSIDITGTKDNDDMNRLISISLRKIQEERQSHAASMNSSSTSSGSNSNPNLNVSTKDDDRQSNRGSISSANSFASANNYEMFEFEANESDCYQSCSSEITTPGDDDIGTTEIRSKFYQLVVDATLAEIELCTNVEDDNGEHHYESIRNNCDPIYEEITDVPPPLPLTAPPINETDLDKKSARSIFEGASKYDILSYLVDAKERGVVREESFEYPINCSNPIIIEEDANDTLSDLGKRKLKKNIGSRSSMLSDSSENNQSTMSLLSPPPNSFVCGSGNTELLARKNAPSNEIERNDSGVGSETSKCSRSKYQSPSALNGALIPKNSPIHLCEDCDGPVETQVTDAGVIFAPLVCRKCGKKRVERKEIMTEIVETEEKYGRDLQIILEEFYHPMLVAGLLTQEQLSAIFLNTEELLENNQTLAEKMRDALDIALEQGDDDLLTVNIGRIFLDFTQMLHAFESYCVRQAGASLLLANLEKEKELLRIFLKVSQMENAVLRRMNLNSFLMVPVQRVTKYPLLLARLYKVTPTHLEGRDLLKQAQEKIELHLNHINQEAKDVPTKLWRRISSSSPNRRASCEIDMINIKLRKMAIDILEWNHDEVRFAMEGKLLYTQPTDSNWKKARSIKLTPVNALLVTNGKPSANYKAEKMSDKLNFPKHTGIREASLLVVKEKCGRYTLIREPLYLDRCVVCSEADLDDYFEVQEISSKDTFIFKAEDGVRTKQWYTQLQYHAQGMGAWRKRRNALANIMINGMLTRT